MPGLAFQGRHAASTLIVAWCMLGRLNVHCRGRSRVLEQQTLRNISKYGRCSFVGGPGSSSLPFVGHTLARKEPSAAPAARPHHNSHCAPIHSQSIQHLHPTFSILVPLPGLFSPCDTTSFLRQRSPGLLYPARFLSRSVFCSCPASPRSGRFCIGSHLLTHYSPYPKLLPSISWAPGAYTSRRYHVSRLFGLPHNSTGPFRHVTTATTQCRRRCSECRYSYE